ncbi:MAG: sortase, partial [Clostridiaceae bacterium]
MFYIHVLDETLAYQVDQIKTIDPTDFSDLLVVKGHDYVTLLTCTPIMINTHRLLVRGHRVDYVAAVEEPLIAENKSSFTFRYLFYGMSGLAALLFLILLRQRSKRKKAERELKKIRAIKKEKEEQEKKEQELLNTNNEGLIPDSTNQMKDEMSSNTNSEDAINSTDISSNGQEHIPKEGDDH